ncbi:MSHA biogenesis protein MshI [Shewanella sp. OPT22]|nr:MSHA biogenesis protein MshI [Shewanella sp. OPT22]
MSAGLYQKLAFWKQSKERVNIGVFLTKNTLWLTVLNEQNHPQYSSVEFDGNWYQAFSQIQQRFPSASLSIALSSEFYQLIQADKPNVDESELKAALIWAVKDLVNVPPANIHLDYFDAPIAANGKVNVVVTAKDTIQDIALAAQKHNVHIKQISIEELLLPKISHDVDQAQLVLCHYEGGELLLSIVKNDAIYLQRRIRGFHALDKMSREDLSYGATDNLSIEIQRSMDFYEGQLRQAPIKKITVVIDNVAEDLADLLKVNFAQTVEAVKIDNVSAYLSGLTLVETEQEVAEVSQ